MSDIVNVPITIVQQNVGVPFSSDKPSIQREGDQEPSAKISEMLAVIAADLALEDLFVVAREATWSRKTTLADLAAFIGQNTVGPVLLQEDIDAQPQKISQLVEALSGEVSADDITAIVAAGENCRMRMIEMQKFFQSLPTSYVQQPLGLVLGKTITTQQILDNTQKIQAMADRMSPENGGSGGPLYIPGPVKFHGIRLHPSVHPVGSGRKSTEWIIGDNCPLTTGTRRVDGIVVPDAPAEARALWYVLARAIYTVGQVTPTQATDAWLTHFSHATINGNKGNQSNNWVGGIYCEGGESDPHFDDVSGGTGNAKAYSGFATYDMEVYSCSGDGLYAGGERQRCYAHFTRSLNHGIVTLGSVVTVAAGFRMKGNDSIVGPRCGSGGSTDSAVIFAGPSGANVTQGNFWPGDLAAPNAATVLSCTGCNGIALHGNTFNGNVFLNSGNTGNDDMKAASCVGNETRFADELFDVTHGHGNPIGLLDATRNAAYTIRGYKQVCVEGNGVSCDKDGRGMQYLLYAAAAGGSVGGASGHAKFSFTTIAGKKPFAAAVTDAVFQEAGCSFVTELIDSTNGRRYLGGATLSGSNSGSHTVLGGWAPKRGAYAMVSGTNLTLLGEPVAVLTAGGTIASLPLFMPVPKCQDHLQEVVFKAAVTTLTPSITPGQQDRPTDGGALQNVTISTTGMPTSIPAGAVVFFAYDRATTQWSYAKGYAALS